MFATFFILHLLLPFTSKVFDLCVLFYIIIGTTFISIYYSDLNHSLNIIYLSDKAMLTVCHRLLCTQSHLYYVSLYYALAVHSCLL